MNEIILGFQRIVDCFRLSSDKLYYYIKKFLYICIFIFIATKVSLEKLKKKHDLCFTIEV